MLRYFQNLTTLKPNFPPLSTKLQLMTTFFTLFKKQKSHKHTSHVFKGLLHCNRTNFQTLSQFIRNFVVNYLKILLLAFPQGKMVLTKKHLISMVLINVLLLGCVNCRPNLESNSISSNDKTEVRKSFTCLNPKVIPQFFPQFQQPSGSLLPPNLNLPSHGDASTNKNYEDSSLPSLKHDMTTKSSSHMKAGELEVGAHGEGHVVERYPITTTDFSRVETPFIIGVWILFASIAKIGEFYSI